jgi:hypothetical protein
MVIYRTKEIRPGVWQEQYKVGLWGIWHKTGPEFNAPPVVEKPGIDPKRWRRQS